MSQETSLRAYYDKVLPHLGERQAQVYEVFNREGMDLTNMEAATRLHWSINRVTPRVLELRRLGFLVLNQRRKCRITGNVAMAWKVKC